MKERLTAEIGRHHLYYAHHEEHPAREEIPFRISPEPLFIPHELRQTIELVGKNVAIFFNASRELITQCDELQELFNAGKPETFRNNLNQARYLFIRPDIILTEQGPIVCEIETSPFGLALSDVLTRSYHDEGFDTLVDPDTLLTYVQSHTDPSGTIVFSDKTKSFRGQLSYLAERVFGRNWRAEHIHTIDTPVSQIYRGYYLSEYFTDKHVRSLIDHIHTLGISTLPTPTPQLEEKALMALVWDRRWESYYLEALGEEGLAFLRAVIPPTWILGQEQHFLPGLPEGIPSSSDLAHLPKSKRQYALKTSGFHPQESWGKGVTFLHKKSGLAVQDMLDEACGAQDALFIVQKFEKPSKHRLEYIDYDGVHNMIAGVRITPYFSAADGTLLSIKATAREGSEYIHGASDSINTAVAVR